MHGSCKPGEMKAYTESPLPKACRKKGVPVSESIRVADGVDVYGTGGPEPCPVYSYRKYFIFFSQFNSIEHIVERYKKGDINPFVDEYVHLK